MTYWIGPCNPNYYDVRGALDKFDNEVDWTKRINIEIGDIFYIYESKTSKRIIAKLEVIDNKVTDKNRLEDDVFWKEEVKISKMGYFRMKLITMFDEGMDKVWLQNNGLKSNLQSPERINPELLRSILDWELDNDIKNNESSSELTTLMIDTEGKRIGYYTYRYERNPKLRQAAIDYHGLNCACCEFNFGKIYGEIGKDFIEVHHIKPISSFTDEETVNPITDLVPLCSNCHRMIHRRKGKVFTVEELKKLLRK
ncbi:HNH endonuclease [Vagococcus fluvialis]|uniref:HNH endonuclease n=1 Tax=Vagococcus fluvialis TaxID=2738 RepID=UPI003B5AF6B2